MSAVLGTNDRRTEIKITYNGQDIYFPLVGDPEYREFGSSDIQTSTLESFSPSVIAGDPTVISNNLLAALTWSNFQSGMATLKYQEQEGTGSLDSFQYSNLNTLYEEMAVLPPRGISLGSLPGNAGISAFAKFLIPDNIGPNLLYFPDSNGANVCVAYRSGTAWTRVALGTATNGNGGSMVAFNGYFVVSTNRGIFYSTNGTTWTIGYAVSPSGTVGLCQHDNKLYTINTTDKKLKWTIDPSLSSWPNSSTDALALAPGEQVNKIVEWKNRSGTRSLFVLTTRRIVAYDDDDYWVEFFNYGNALNATSGDMEQWLQDKALYFAPVDNGANIIQFQNQTISNVSPNKRSGLKGGLSRIFTSLTGGLSYLFARTSPPALTSIIGATGNNPIGNTYGITAYNGRGWHTIIERPNNIGAVTYSRNQLIYLLADGVSVETVYFPDSAQPIIHDTGPVTYAEGTFYIQSGETDAALEAITKTGRYWELQITDTKGVGGLPANHTARLFWSFNGSEEVQQGSTLTSASAFPARIPVHNLAGPQAPGVAWVRMYWRLEITKLAGADPTVTPVLRSLTHYYLRTPNLVDGIQFRIDLSQERFATIKGGKWKNRDRKELYDYLMTIKNAKTNPAITYGRDGAFTVIPAAEIRIAGQENAATATGIYTVTARTVATPASG